MSLGAPFKDDAFQNIRVANNSALSQRITSSEVETNAIVTNSLAVLEDATEGYVLTSDADGNATWQEPTPQTTISDVTTTFSLPANDGAINAVQIGDLVKGRFVIISANGTIGSGTTLATISPAPPADVSFVSVASVGGGMSVETTVTYTISDAGLITADTLFVASDSPMFKFVYSLT